MTKSEVSSARSTQRMAFRRNTKLREPMGKEQIHREKLNPNYVAGFVDGEGSFCVGIGKHKTLRRGIEVHPLFEIEVRADDREVLERILVTIGCGKIYDCSYERYGWQPHVKYKVGSSKELEQFVIPFFEKYPLQAKKAQSFNIFKEIIKMMRRKEHLTDNGFVKIVAMRDQLRKIGRNQKRNLSVETARVRENRSPGGVRQEI
ncbi:MAG TPA: LAGLIDADG family homing endonuclease [Candidatus Paceibacterota bacterium]|nr:LAGLIDADG family homing endonuclease [Candidatus Paceibacterota bacterium]